jgi:hypothetical protein
MTKPDRRSVVPIERIESAIFLVRGHKVMVDRDLAALYGVTTFNLNKAVKRNADRFPEDFMFQLTAEEADALRFQVGMSKGKGRGGRRYLPYVFTEQGVAMLSSVLRASAPFRSISKSCELLSAYAGCLPPTKIWPESSLLWKKKYDAQFKVVFDARQELMAPPVPKKRKIGFLVKERAARYGRA